MMTFLKLLHSSCRLLFHLLCLLFLKLSVIDLFYFIFAAALRLLKYPVTTFLNFFYLKESQVFEQVWVTFMGALKISTCACFLTLRPKLPDAVSTVGFYWLLVSSFKSYSGIQQPHSDKKKNQPTS